MPRYKYKAKNLDNRMISGIMDAFDEDDLSKRLREDSLVLQKSSEMKELLEVARLGPVEVADFSKQMSYMLRSGITVLRALDILKSRKMPQKQKNLFEIIYRDVQKGSTLSEAMAVHERAFPPIFVNMCASGEASGTLERALDKMATHFEKEYKLNSKIKSAMTYPMILLYLTIAIVLLIFTVILPQFFDLFEGIDIPLITQIVIAMSKFLQSYWYIVIIGALLVFLIVKVSMEFTGLRYAFDKLKVHVPKAGDLMKTIYTARFSRTLSSLYSSGLSMIKALEISATTLGNSYIEGQFAAVVRDIRNGESLSLTLAKVDGFDQKFANILMIGEESGQLDGMLESSAENFDYEADSATSRLIQFIEPAMLVFMAVVIGSILLSVMLPMMTFYQSVGGM